MFAAVKNHPVPLRLARCALLIGTAGLFCSATPAQDYPNRSVRVIVPFSAGGAVDDPPTSHVAGQQSTARDALRRPLKSSDEQIRVPRQSRGCKR